MPKIQIAQEPAADELLSNDSFALLTGMLLDQQFPMERAFAGPAKIRDRFGTMDPVEIADADPEAFADLCATPPAIHRYGRSMAGRVQALAKVVAEEYGGDAARIWTEAADGAEAAHDEHPADAKALRRRVNELERENAQLRGQVETLQNQLQRLRA